VGSELQKIGKRRIKFLAVLLSLSIVLSSSLTSMAYGTIEKEYEYFCRPLDTKLYEFRVKVIIETEKDGTWKSGTEYEVYFTIILDYINRNFIKSLTFYNAQLVGFGEQSSYPSYITLNYSGRGVFELLVNNDFCNSRECYLKTTSIPFNRSCGLTFNYTFVFLIAR
jgi:hypothetical protein